MKLFLFFSIENSFGYIKNKLRNLNCSNRQKVIKNLGRVWGSLDQDYFKNLARSMPRRIQACIQNDYYPTKY